MVNYKTIELSSEQKGFEQFRWHGINYILSKGELVIGNSRENGRERQECDEFEYGTIVNDKGFYSFFVEERKKNQVRKLKVVIGSENNSYLEDKIQALLDLYI
ncbi:MAG: hypothetical protein PHF86_12390 [Candidatus Nanoarchaeia archaeon]|nr:hypothetical protein [Candidatus Nanoarchaeia archaeon]